MKLILSRWIHIKLIRFPGCQTQDVPKLQGKRYCNHPRPACNVYIGSGINCNSKHLPSLMLLDFPLKESLFGEIMFFHLRSRNWQLFDGSLGYTRAYDTRRVGKTCVGKKRKGPHTILRLLYLWYYSTGFLWSDQRNCWYLSEVRHVATCRCKFAPIYIVRVPTLQLHNTYTYN